MGADGKALKLLKKSACEALTKEERQYCEDKGVLCKYEPMSHKQMILRIKELSLGISVEKAARAFLYSVSSEDLRYRTVLSSLIWARALPVHRSEKAGFGSRDCAVCGMTEYSKWKSDCDLFDSFCRDRLFPDKTFMDICRSEYVYCDLKIFENLPEVDFNDDDIRIVNRIFGLAQQIGSGNNVNALLKLIGADKDISLKSANVYSILGVLAACGVFDTPEHKSYVNGFVNCSDRGFVYENEIYYPLNYWRGKHGINYDAINSIFGGVTDKLTAENAIKTQVSYGEEKKNRSAAEKYFTDGEHLIDLSNDKRYYYGLQPIEESWHREVRFSATYKLMKRSEIFFEGDVIKKLIYEEKYEGQEGGSYLEADMEVKTRERRLMLPKTGRGREKPLTASALQSVSVMQAQLHVILGENGSITSFNSSNDQYLPLTEGELHTKKDFEKYTEKYISLVPTDYEKQLDNFINKKRKRVKACEGDIIRIQLTPTKYTYALIIGVVRQLLEQKAVPENHPYERIMSQPLMYRQYAIVTENPQMTVEELEKVPLMEMQTAQDNEVHWETYPVVCRKELTEEDIDLGFYFCKNKVVWGFSVKQFHKLPVELASMKADTYGLYLYMQFDNGGYKCGIIPHRETEAERIKKIIAGYLNFGENYTSDDFAARFGGITRKQYLRLLKSR